VTDPEQRSLAQAAKAWPFEEARRLQERFAGKPPEKGYVLFETGYGPSGLPHIGTFGEVVRTSMVRRAFRLLTDLPTKLLRLFRTTWTGCARCRTTSRTRTCCARTWASR
jgi:lysyl-tRNA synthetase class 1